ncbi:MAG: hypothetical protein JW795_09835 [Chitinivibrionales bacterium]|nr:hypothetical protein [Chitinivibrionales bacterium]
MMQQLLQQHSHRADAVSCYRVVFGTVAFLLVSIVVSGCGPKPQSWRPAVVYSLHGWHEKKFTEETNICVFPLIIDSTFDTSGVMRQADIASQLPKEWKHGILKYREEFADSAARQGYTDSLADFYRLLATDNLLAVQTKQKMWSAMPCDYLLTVRIVNSLHIKTYGDIHKRSIILEGNLWDTKLAEVVWRCRTSGSEVNATRPEKEFLSEGIHSLLTLMPPVASGVDQKNW